MDGQAKTLYWFSDEKIEIEVPFFQRPYVWCNDDKNDNWTSLINNIIAAPAATMPFIGSFILKEKREYDNNTSREAHNNKYLIIDGQQRITTLNILIRSFLDVSENIINRRTLTKLEDIIYSAETTPTGEDIFKLRITPSNADSEAFRRVMDSKQEEREGLVAGKSRISDCYLFFKEYFQSLSNEELTHFASKLLTLEKFFVEITLGPNDDEQVIFDTVNSLGRKLTNSDIVKNYLYQRMKNLCGDDFRQQQKVLEHYQRYWEKVFLDDKRDFWDEEISLGRITTTNLDAFLKDFGTIRGTYMPSESGGIEGLTKKYKDRIDTLTEEELFAFSKELSEYGMKYYEIWKEFEDCRDFRISEPINVTLLMMNQLETSTFNPYILKIIKENDPQLEEKLKALQKFVMKRLLWKASKKNYNKCCLEVLKADFPNQYFEDYNNNTDGVDWSEYPMQVKNLNNRQGAFLLFLIEMIRRFNHGEQYYPDPLVYNRKLDSLEHIMPQKWKKNWDDVPSFKLDDQGDYVEVNGEEKEANRKAKIRSLGNMTLLTVGLNSTISNSSFVDKIEGTQKYKGYKQFVGGLSIAQEIVDSFEECHKWDERDIMERELSLINELNSFYGFGPEIVDKLEEPIPTNMASITSEFFNDDYYSQQKVQTIVRDGFAYLFSNNLLSEADIELLKQTEYSRINFGLWLPLLEVGRVHTRRYYKKPIAESGDLYLCKEWYEKNKDKVVTWLKTRIK